MYGCNMKYMAAILYIWLQYYTYMAAIWLQCNIYGCNAVYMAAMLYIYIYIIYMDAMLYMWIYTWLQYYTCA